MNSMDKLHVNNKRNFVWDTVYGKIMYNLNCYTNNLFTKDDKFHSNGDVTTRIAIRIAIKNSLIKEYNG